MVGTDCDGFDGTVFRKQDDDELVEETIGVMRVAIGRAEGNEKTDGD